jgi:hypothetical protein
MAAQVISKARRPRSAVVARAPRRDFVSHGSLIPILSLNRGPSGRRDEYYDLFKS